MSHCSNFGKIDPPLVAASTKCSVMGISYVVWKEQDTPVRLVYLGPLLRSDVYSEKWLSL